MWSWQEGDVKRRIVQFTFVPDAVGRDEFELAAVRGDEKRGV